jgi:hypothetical protein
MVIILISLLNCKCFADLARVKLLGQLWLAMMFVGRFMMIGASSLGTTDACGWNAKFFPSNLGPLSHIPRQPLGMADFCQSHMLNLLSANNFCCRMMYGLSNPRR